MPTYYEEKNQSRSAGCRGVAIGLLFILGFALIALIAQYGREIDFYIEKLIK